MRARSRAPSPAKNSSASAAHDLPLLGVGVLRLVDQDVVEAAIELEQHPWRDARAGAADRARAEHKIVVIEQRLAPLCCLHRRRINASPSRIRAQLASTQRGRATASRKVSDPFSLRAEHRHEHRSRRCEPRSVVISDFAGLALVGQKCSDIRRQASDGARAVVSHHAASTAPRSRSVQRSVGERRCSRSAAASRPRRRRRRTPAMTASSVVPPGKLEGCGRACARSSAWPSPSACAELAALGDERRHQLAEAFLGEHGRRPLPAPRRARRPCRRARQCITLARPRPALRARCARRSRAKCGGDSRLQRKAAQQRLAEGVDRRDLDAARRIENAREELARPRDRRARWARARSASPAPRPARRRGSVAQSASRSLRRFAISAAAARVKVRQRMRAGSRAAEHQRAAGGRSAPWSCRCRPRRRPRPMPRDRPPALRRGRHRRPTSFASLGARPFVEPLEMRGNRNSAAPIAAAAPADRAWPDRRSGRSARSSRARRTRRSARRDRRRRSGSARPAGSPPLSRQYSSARRRCR